MADRIKGITIEIDGKTDKLQSALKDVNKVIKDTQSDLKDVDKLLKLDPKNTELLTQKHQLLSKAVGETKEKLQTLKTAQEQMNASGVDKSSAEYQALSREIIECEQSLKKLEKAAIESNVALQKVAETGKSLDKVGSNITSVGKQVSKASAVVATGMTAAVKTTMDFDSAMSKVYAVANADEKQMEQMRETALKWGRDTNYSATEVAEGLYYMSLAGWDAEKSQQAIGSALKLAAASGEELATTSDIVTDVMSAYGMKAEETAHFTDVMASAMSHSNTDLEGLGEAMKYVGSVAGGMGYNVEDTALAIGLMSNQSVKGSMAGTALRSTLSRMADPTDKVAIAMEELNISLADEKGNMYSLKEVMDQIRGSFGELKISEDELYETLDKLNTQLENGEITEKEFDQAQEELMERAYGAEGALKAQYASILAGKNALAGYLAIVNTSEEDYNKLTDAIYNCNGATDQMYSKMTDNLQGEVDKLKSKLEDLAIQFGDILTPCVRKFVEHLETLIDKFRGLSDTQKEIIVVIGAIVVALGPLLIVIGSVISAIGKIMIFAPILVSGISTVVGAIGSVVAIIGGPLLLAIGAVIAAIVVWVKNWDDIKEAARLACEIVGEKVEELKNKVSNAIDTIKNVIEGLKFAWNLILDNIVGSIKDKWAIITTAFDVGFEHIKKLFAQKLEFPKIKLPHFKISGSLSLNPPSVPSIGIDWYKKAYDDAYLLNSPTIFGASGGQLLGGGEGNGSEAVVGTDKLMDMMSEVVGSQNVTVVLEGDASEVFRLVRAENTRFVKSNGYSPLMA